MKVSWQITGVRHDVYAEKNPFVVENCGAVMPPGSPGGHCPSCLLRIGLALADGGLALGLDNTAPESPAISDPPPSTRIRYVGDYELVEEIGRYRDRPLREGLDLIADCVRDWSGGQLRDDVSLLGVERITDSFL